MAGKKKSACSNCLSHRAAPVNNMLYGGALMCHFYPEPIVCKSPNHWCRQWEPEKAQAEKPKQVLAKIPTDTDGTLVPAAASVSAF